MKRLLSTTLLPKVSRGMHRNLETCKWNEQKRRERRIGCLRAKRVLDSRDDLGGYIALCAVKPRNGAEHLLGGAGWQMVAGHASVFGKALKH